MKYVGRFLVLFVLFAAIGTIFVWKTGSQNADSGQIPEEAVPTLIQFSSDSCVYCKEMEPIIEDLGQEYEGRVIIKLVNVNENTEEAKENKIRVVPTQVFFNAQGEGVARHEGYMTKEEILEVFQEIGVK